MAGMMSKLIKETLKLGYRDYSMAERSKDWLAQAERDLEQAKSSQKEG
jgi:hypothetical protein